MYAIVSTGGKQYKVAEGDVIAVEKLDAEPGTTVELDVLALNDGKKLITDAAILESQKVSAEVLEQFKGEKQLVFKFKKRKRYARTRGHRQQLTRLEVVSLPSGKKPRKKAAPVEAPAEAEAEAQTEEAAE